MMKKKMMKNRIVISILLLGSFVCKAQTELTLEQCKKMALEHNQTLKSAEAELSGCDASYTLSKRSVLPQFDLSGSYTYLGDPAEMNVPSFELPTINHTPSGVLYPGGKSQLAYNNSYSVTMGVSLPLYMGGKLNELKKMSGFGKQIAEENLVYEKSELVYSTDEQYWSLVSLKERRLLVEKSIAFLSDLVKDMQNRYESELVTKNEVLKTMVDLNDAKLDLVEVSDGIELSKMALNNLIGNDILADIIVVDSIVNIPNNLSVVEFIEKSLNNRPEIKIMEKQLDLAESQLKLVKSDYKPQLVSFANYLYQNPNHFGVDEGEFTWNAGFSFNIPVFHWGERSLKIHEQKMENRKTELQYESTKEFLVLEIQQAIFMLKESLIKIKITKESLLQAEENLKLERNRLDEGLITTTDILNAQMQWQVSFADYIDAKVNFKITESNYYKSIGELKF